MTRSPDPATGHTRQNWRGRGLRALACLTVLAPAAAAADVLVTNAPTSSVVTLPDSLIGPAAPLLAGGPATRLNGPVSVVLDSVRNELIVANLFSEAITVFDAQATDGAAPRRVLRGPATGLAAPTGLVLDPVRDELLVAASFGQSVLAFERTASGDTAPLRTLSGPATLLSGPRAVALDTLRGELFVTNTTNHSVTVYAHPASGDQAPVRVLGGAATGLDGPRGLTLDLIADELFVANASGHSITVYARDASGDAAPLRTLSGLATGLATPVGVAINRREDELLVTGGEALAAFARSASGDTAPLVSRAGAGASLVGPVGVNVIGTAPLFAAVLPASRSIQTGALASAFATVINAGPVPVAACAPILETVLPATYGFHTTNAANEPTGPPSTPASIAPGEQMTMVLWIAPDEPFAPTEVRFGFACENTRPAQIGAGLNTLLLTASATPVPDIVAVAATVANDGIVDATGGGAFSIAIANVGSGGQIHATADTGTASLPLTLLICETDPPSGNCKAPAVAADAGVFTTVAPGGTHTYAAFAFASDAVAFDPAGSRVFVRFADASGIVTGTTSVAVVAQ